MSFPDFSSVDQKALWQRYCDLLWFHEDLGMWLDISRIDFTSKEFDLLVKKFSQAFIASKDIESGLVANKDENRMVGHYWLRNSDLAPTEALGSQIDQEVMRIKDFGGDVLSGKITNKEGNKFTDVIWIGIGGSGLGPMLLNHSLGSVDAGLNFHFIDNVDPQGINKIFSHIGDRLKTSLCITVSKSGSTPEPNIAMLQTRRRIESLGLKWNNHSVAVTSSGSKLDSQAKSEKWVATFDLPDWVGGRTSITSSVGLLTCSLLSVDIDEFLNGASAMDEATRVPDVRSNPSALLASAWYLSSGGKGLKDMVVLPYRDRLELFSRYLQQLVMESLGKKYDRDDKIVNQGISVYGNKGSTDQHAYVQQLRDGINNFFVTFIEVLEDIDSQIPPINNNHPGDYLSGFLQGTREALTEGGRQNLTITLNTLTPRTLGALIALFERSVTFYAELININAYNQPGVEAGKKAAAVVLNLQENIENVLSDGLPRSITEIQSILGIESPESIFLILRHLHFNKRGYSCHGNWASPVTLRFSRIKTN